MEAAETLAVARARPALTLGRAILLVGILLAIAVPFAAKSFLVFQLTLVLVYAIAICGLNLLTGFNGQFSLGHGAFYAIGAYTAAILMEHGGVSYVWTIPAAGAVCFVAGFLFGLPALRLEAIYLALATFALAVAAPQILKLSPLEHWTGGVQGIVILKPDAPFGLPLNQDQWLYFFTLGVALAMFFAAHNLVHSRTGRAIMAIRDNPIAARSMGINTALYKTLTFGVSARSTRASPARSGRSWSSSSPRTASPSRSRSRFLVGLVVGGVGWIPGALFGGAFVLFVPNIAEHISKGLSSAAYGVILILLIYLMPSGAGGFFQLLANRAAKWRRRPREERT